MRKTDEQGALSSIILVIVLLVALVGSVAFGFWAYSSRNDYKNNSDQKASKAVQASKSVQRAELQKQFDEQAKLPSKTYQGPTTYGSVTFKYPKTWNAYVDQTSSQNPIVGYFYPDIVPGASSGTAYALKVNLISTPYDQDLKRYDGLIKLGKVKAAAYVPPQMVNVTNVQVGTRFDGEIVNKLTGSMVMIKVRDKTLEISTESTDFMSDFDNVVLKNLTFIP